MDEVLSFLRYEMISAFMQIFWVILSNSYLLPFLITGIIMWIGHNFFGIWFGSRGGRLLYFIVWFTSFWLLNIQ
jgi:hypothetical protein